jgi:protein O-GlcNAc transferase
MKEIKKAIECYNKCIELDPTYYVCYSNKATALNDLKKYEDAIDSANEAINLNPIYEDSYYEKGKKKYQNIFHNYPIILEIFLRFCIFKIKKI